MFLTFSQLLHTHTLSYTRAQRHTHTHTHTMIRFKTPKTWLTISDSFLMSSTEGNNEDLTSEKNNKAKTTKRQHRQ